jgi:hypothetical protein
MGREVSNLVEEFKPLDIGQFEIEEDESIEAFHEARYGLPPTGSGLHFVALGLKVVSNHLDDGWGIVNY